QPPGGSRDAPEAARRPWYLRHVNYCYVFHEDFAEAISFHVHRQPAGLDLLTRYLDRLFTKGALDRGDLDPYLVTELIRRRTLAAASLSGPPTTSAPPSAGPGSPSAPPRWLDECRRATLQTYRSAAARAGTPDSQLDRARALLDLLTVVDSLAAGE